MEVAGLRILEICSCYKLRKQLKVLDSDTNKIIIDTRALNLRNKIGISNI